MAELSRPGVKVSELYQAGIAVHDLEKSIEHYQNTFGIGPWGIMAVDPSTFSEMTYRGRPVQHTFKAAFATAGPLQLELIQPIEGDNVLSDFLKEHGEGVHHLGHVRVENLAQAIKTWEGEGFSCLQSGHSPGGGYAYMDTIKALGTVIELLELP